MDFTMILPILIGVGGLFIVLKLLALPMKLIIKLVINGLVGGLIIFIVNLVGANFGFTIALNWITALIVGILGVPRSSNCCNIAICSINQQNIIRFVEINQCYVFIICY